MLPDGPIRRVWCEGRANSAQISGRALIHMLQLGLVDPSAVLDRIDEVFRVGLSSDHVPMLLKIGSVRAYGPSSRLPWG